MITFLRHAESELNVTGKFSSRIDCHITEKGKLEAEKLAGTLPSFDLYFCSPLKRTQETLFAMYPNANPIIDERITEVSCGIWENTVKTNVDPILRKRFQFGTYVPLGGESRTQVNERAISFLKEVFQNYPKQKTLVVTHNGFLRSIKQLCHISEESLQIKNLGYFTITEKDFFQ